MKKILLYFFGVAFLINPSFSQLNFQSWNTDAGLSAEPTKNVNVVDLNGDGFEDILANHLQSGLKYYENQRNGLFETKPLSGIVLADEVLMSSWVDINNDGLQDLITLTSPVNHLSAFFNLGDYQFDQLDMQIFPEIEINITAIFPADLNSDGWVDLICKDSQNRLYFFQNNQNEQFTDQTTESGLNDMGTVTGHQIFDMDNDLDLDLVLVKDDMVSFWENIEGAFTALTDSEMSFNQPIRSLSVGDCNRDGFLDLYLTTEANNFLFENKKDQTFEDISEILGVNEHLNANQINWMDYDIDGSFDLVLADFQDSKTLEIYQNNDPLGFESTEIDASLQGISNGTGLINFDINKDGLQDLLLISQSSPGMRYYLNRNNSRYPYYNYVSYQFETADYKSTDGLQVLTVTEENEFLNHLSSPSNQNKTTVQELNIGLNDASNIERIEVYWPDGTIDIFYDLPSDKRYLIKKQMGIETLESYEIPQFEDYSATIHKSNNFSNSVSFGDYDNDGDDDIYIGRLSSRTNLFYKNKGDWKFEEVGGESNLRATNDGHVSAWGDFNNDGWLDLFVGVQYEGNALYLNNGNRTFFDIAESAGVDAIEQPNSVSLADVNRDGFLDIYVCNLTSENILYINNGDLTFTDKTQEAGVSDTKIAMGSTFFDYDNDGDPDLYLVHDADQDNILFKNDGTGNFTNVAPEAGLDYAANGMGVDFGDYNHDGWFDIYVTNLFENVLFLNNGDGTFKNRGQISRTFDLGMAWSTFFFDYNNDSWQDLYVANDSKFSPFPNLIYQNLGNGSFFETSTETIMASMSSSYGAATSDLDNDGNLDIVVANRSGSEGNEMYRNLNTNGNWIKFKLIGTVNNTAAIGARITIEYGDGSVQMDEVASGTGYASQNSLTLHFGMGENEMIDKVTVDWMGQSSEIFENIEGNNYYQITEGQGIENLTEETTSIAEEIEEERLFHIVAFPNPFSEELSISFNLSQQSDIRFSILDLDGKIVDRVFSGKLAAGKQELSWNAFQALRNGVYFGLLETNGQDHYFKIHLSR